MQNQINVRKRHPARTRAENRPPIQQVIFNFSLWLFFLTFLFAASVYAHGPTRQKVSESIEIEAPAEKVWGIVGAYDQLHTCFRLCLKQSLLRGTQISPER